MNANLNQELLNLSVAERIQLAEDLWDSVVLAPEQLGLSEPQREVLEHRLSQFSSDTPVNTWEEVKQRLTAK
jgi:putative addiction module component (TIGR02574 family)